MTALVQRLRTNAAPLGDPNLNDESADEIERLHKGWSEANSTILDRDLKIVELKDAIARLTITPRTEPVARLLHWKAPAHIPVPHDGIAARTFAEFPKDAMGEQRYWHEGELLYTRSALEQWPLVVIERLKATPAMVRVFLSVCGRHYPFDHSDPAILEGLDAAIKEGRRQAERSASGPSS